MLINPKTSLTSVAAAALIAAAIAGTYEAKAGYQIVAFIESQRLGLGYLGVALLVLLQTEAWLGSLVFFLLAFSRSAYLAGVLAVAASYLIFAPNLFEGGAALLVAAPALVISYLLKRFIGHRRFSTREPSSLTLNN